MVEERRRSGMSRSFRFEGSSFRNIGRSNSSLIAKELVGSEIAKVGLYERLSASMRVTANDCSDDYSCRRKKIRGWSSLINAFSLKKRISGADDFCRGQVVEAAAKPQKVVRVVAAEKKKKKAIWFPDPHRRWPVQGW